MQMPGRYGTGDYRYGFQGQEKDEKTGLINYKYRMYRPEIGKFFAVDPLAPKYPHNSPYAFSENSLIWAVELEGLEKWIVVNNNGSQEVYKWSDIFNTQNGPMGTGTLHLNYEDVCTTTCSADIGGLATTKSKELVFQRYVPEGSSQGDVFSNSCRA